jgi:type II secretory pathway component PulF
MADFVYEARDKFGKLVKGTVGGDSLQAVSNRLQAAGYVPVRIDHKVSKAGWKLSFFNHVKERDLNLFTRQLLTLQRAGLPLLSGLRSLEQQARSSVLRLAIAHTIIDIESGLSLHEALARQPHVFDSLYVHMVEAGEASGRLDDILERLAFLNERNEETKAKIRSALRYPALTFFAIISAFGIIISFTMPKFVAIFQMFQTELPLPTRILIGINHVIQNYWVAMIAVSVVSVLVFKRYIRTKRGRYQWHGFLLKLPIFGPLLHEIYMSRFARNLATLIQSGLPLMDALELVGTTVNNAVIEEAVFKVQANVSEGKSMHDPMSESKLFSPIVVQMVAIGEETGKVDELLNHIADYFDRETDLKIKNMTTMIEPLLICFMGGLVLLLALGVFLPMWNLINLFKQV